MSHFKAENAPNSAGAPPQTSLGSLHSDPPDLLAGFKGDLLLRGGEGRKGEKGKREETRGGRGKGRGREWTP